MFWNENQINFLIDNMGHMTNGEIAEKLETTERAVQSKLRRLSLKRTPEQRRNIWSRVRSPRLTAPGPSNPNWKGGISENNYHYKKIQCSRYPERIKARKMVGNQIRSGKLIRLPCEICGEHETTAHHDDYSKPLDVKWLCRKCHRLVHDGKY